MLIPLYRLIFSIIRIIGFAETTRFKIREKIKSYMKEKLTLLFSELKSLVEKEFTPVVEKEIEQLNDFLSSVESSVEQYGHYPGGNKNDNYLPVLEGTYKYNAEIFALINVRHSAAESVKFDDKFESYISAINTYIDSLDTELVLPQNDERFIIQHSDRINIKLLKRFKRIFFNITQIPTGTANLFRKIFKKEIKTKKLWSHRIPYRNLAYYILRDDFIAGTVNLFDELNKEFSGIYLKIWNLDEKIAGKFFELFDINTGLNNIEITSNKLKDELEDIRLNIKNAEENFNNRIEETLNKLKNKFEEAFELAGTVELPRRIVDKDRIDKKHSLLNDLFMRQHHQWQSTYFALFEDWRLNKDVYIAALSIYEKYFKLVNDTEEKISQKILSRAARVNLELENIKVQINSMGNDPVDLKNYLIKQKEIIQKRLADDIIPSVIDELLKLNIPSSVDGFEDAVRKVTDELSPKRALVKNADFSSRIKDSEINYISPKELILFEKLPGFIEAVLNIKNRIVREIDNIRGSLHELIEISDFNLESAVAIFENKESGEDENPKKIAVEGINRATGKTNAVLSDIAKINTILKEGLSQAVINYNNGILELTSTEKVFNIRLKIAKAKAVERTKIYRQNAAKFIKKSLPRLAESVKKGYGGYRQLINNVQSKFGLTPPAETISAEISDFLTETQAAIRRLPFVYQRLFQVEALSEDRFFYGREYELGKLSEASANWEKRFYAATALVGEKGSGTTSVINIFLSKLKADIPVKRYVLKRSIYNEKEFLHFAGELFGEQQFNNFNQIVDYVNNLKTRQIIIIENFQKMYLKKVDGFDALKLFFELISKTNKNIFWITAVTYYAWEYLNKTLMIADYFGYVVKMAGLKDEEIIEIITRRHRVSGYKIVYEPAAEDLNSKAFKKLDSRGRQEYLRKEYFSGLNKFAKSNISLALIFWLRSTKAVTENTITISSLKEMNFSFLSALSQEKLFTLHALILHDGLTEELHALIFGQPAAKSRSILLLLLDDGIVINQNGYFVINPLLYRQAINLLHSKNILH